MPHKVMDDWLASNRTYLLLGRPLRPLRHPVLVGAPLSIRRGQAEAYYLRASDRSSWILKKFHPQWEPERVYSRRVSLLLPRVEAFVSGLERCVIEQATVNGAPPELSRWLDGTIFMPRIRGSDWAHLADLIRAGTVSLAADRRLLLCRNLARLVDILERNGVSHRDISNANVFIEPLTLNVHLIDWDSVYHADLPMPQNTTCGTPGYAAPFAWVDGRPNASSLWNAQGDRFALAVMCVEFLVTDTGSPFAGEGGLFEQRELAFAHGSTLHGVRRKLASTFPRAGHLFEQALRARDAAACPTPQQWEQACRNGLEPASADAVANVSQAGFLPRKFDFAAPHLAPPRPVEVMQPVASRIAPPLPSNPWRVA